MDRFLNKSIKEVITEFPQVGVILNECGIGCVTCSVGTCLLKDVISIHGLPKAQKSIVMAKIQKIIDPNAEIVIQDMDVSAAETAPQTIKYSPPMKRLVEEHARIMRLLALIPYIVSKIQQATEIDRDLIEHSAFFIQNYADKYHHAKEEDILFKYTDERQAIIQAMYEDHQTGRNFVKLVLTGLQEGRKDDVVKSLESYKDLLTQHIKKEDEILYPWIDRTLTTEQTQEMLSSFDDADQDFYLQNISEQFDSFLSRLENKYKEELY